MRQLYRRFKEWCTLGWLWEWFLKEEIKNNAPKPKAQTVIKVTRTVRLVECKCRAFNCRHTSNPLHVRNARRRGKN